MIGEFDIGNIETVRGRWELDQPMLVALGHHLFIRDELLCQWIVPNQYLRACTT